MMDSLYAQYIQERQGISSIWAECGFITYRFINDEECFIEDMFIRKEDRANGKGRALLDRLAAIALENKRSIITANIHLWDPNANATLKAAQACGFIVKASGNNLLLIAKEFRKQEA